MSTGDSANLNPRGCRKIRPRENGMEVAPSIFSPRLSHDQTVPSSHMTGHLPEARASDTGHFSRDHRHHCNLVLVRLEQTHQHAQEQVEEDTQDRAFEA